jgi:hypothetical protein
MESDTSAGVFYDVGSVRAELGYNFIVRDCNPFRDVTVAQRPFFVGPNERSSIRSEFEIAPLPEIDMVPSQAILEV